MPSVPARSARLGVAVALLTAVTTAAAPLARAQEATASPDPSPGRAVAAAPTTAPTTAPAPAPARAPAPAGPSTPTPTPAPTGTADPTASAAPQDPSASPSASPAVPVLPPATATSTARLCRGRSAESPVAVEVSSLSPRAPTRSDETFAISGRLVNCGSEPLAGVQVRIAVGARIGTRSQLRLAAAEPVVGSRRLPSADAVMDRLVPGASTAFDVRVPVGDLRLGQRNGVYPLAVQARARTGSSGERGPVGLASTFVPWFPEGPVAPTRLAWVVPLVDEPHRGPAEVMLDDELDALLEDDPDAAGRLARALVGARVGARGACDEAASPGSAAGSAAGSAPDRPAPTGPDTGPTTGPAGCRGEPVPVTYALDPDLLYSAEAMTRPYSVLRAGRRTDRPRSANAEQWLVSIRAAAAEGDVLALPYGDPDVVALSRTDSPVKDDVEQLLRLGQSDTRRLLGSEPLTTVAWPPAGPVASAVDPLAAGQGTALLLDESVLVPEASRDRTPSARTTVPSTLDPVTALVADASLSRLVAPDRRADGWQGERLAEQRWIAESALIAAERPGQSRTLVVAPDRRADLLPAVLAGAVADTGRLPWLCGVPLADVAAGTERCATLDDPQAPADAERGVALRGGPPDSTLPPSFVRDIGEVRRLSDQLTEQVLIAESDTAKDSKARLLRARGRAASSAWRDEPAAARRMLGLLQDDVAALRSRVTLVGRPALLTGRVGTVQLVVQNRLDQPVNVGVRLDPNSAVRLTSEDTEIQAVPARSTQQVSVRVEARTSGRFTARAGLIDASGQAFGSTVEFGVRSTQYGRVALAVTGVAAAVLMVAAGLRIARRATGRPGADVPGRDG